MDRRTFIGNSSLGLGGLALGSLLEGRAQAAIGLHHAPRAKRIIYLHMIGAHHTWNMFTEKPELVKRHNHPCPAEVTKDRDFAFIGKTSTLAGSPWKFSRHGQSGHTFSELLPNLAGVADELAMIHSIHSDEINHAPAQMFLHSGLDEPVGPAWVHGSPMDSAARTPTCPPMSYCSAVQLAGLGPRYGPMVFCPVFIKVLNFAPMEIPFCFCPVLKGHRAGSPTTTRCVGQAEW